MIARTGLRLRPYAPADAAATLQVFLAAVTTTAAGDYSPEQIAAWAGADDWTEDAWHRGLAAGTIVAEQSGAIAGFSDIDDTGYIDRLFVHPAFARQGVASALFGEVLYVAHALKVAEMWTNASITARPFFEHNGFTVVREQWPVVRGVALKN